MADMKFPCMYYPKLWRAAPKILYNQADLDNFLAVVTLADWVKSPDPPIDAAEAPKYEKYPKTLYSVQIASQVVENSNQEALLSASYHPLELSANDIEAAKQTAELQKKQRELEEAAIPESVKQENKARQEALEKAQQQQPKPVTPPVTSPAAHNKK